MTKGLQVIHPLNRAGKGQLQEQRHFYRYLSTLNPPTFTRQILGRPQRIDDSDFSMAGN